LDLFNYRLGDIPQYRVAAIDFEGVVLLPEVGCYGLIIIRGCEAMEYD
jgi:hypothetical protein